MFVCFLKIPCSSELNNSTVAKTEAETADDEL